MTRIAPLAAALLAILATGTAARAENEFAGRQTGAYNAAASTLKGARNYLGYVQDGVANEIEMDETGYRNRTAAGQFGNGNVLRGALAGKRNEFGVVQYGDGNELEHSASGRGNSTAVYQNGNSRIRSQVRGNGNTQVFVSE